MIKRVKLLAKIIWNYHLMYHKVEPSDLIMVLGSHDIRIAERGVDLYFEKMSPKILFSGGLGNLTRGIWDEPEADKFAKIALKKGVPEQDILTENKSTNTGENIRFSYELLKSKGLIPESIILVQKPYMERRVYATFMKQWPDTAIKTVVTAPQISFEDYPNDEITEEDVINIMLGDLQRIKIYPHNGYQIYQEIPDDVWDAYEELIKMGYNKYLLK